MNKFYTNFVLLCSIVSVRALQCQVGSEIKSTLGDTVEWATNTCEDDVPHSCLRGEGELTAFLFITVSAIIGACVPTADCQKPCNELATQALNNSEASDVADSADITQCDYVCCTEDDCNNQTIAMIRERQALLTTTTTTTDATTTTTTVATTTTTPVATTTEVASNSNAETERGGLDSRNQGEQLPPEVAIVTSPETNVIVTSPETNAIVTSPEEDAVVTSDTSTRAVDAEAATRLAVGEQEVTTQGVGHLVVSHLMFFIFALISILAIVK